jgi:hypothetical protein
MRGQKRLHPTGNRTGIIGTCQAWTLAPLWGQTPGVEAGRVGGSTIFTTSHSRDGLPTAGVDNRHKKERKSRSLESVREQSRSNEYPVTATATTVVTQF